MKKRSILSLTALAVMGVSAYALTVRPIAGPDAVQQSAANSKADPKVERGECLVKINYLGSDEIALAVAEARQGEILGLPLAFTSSTAGKYTMPGWDLMCYLTETPS